MTGYLISTDGYRDGVLLDRIALDQGGVLKILEDWLNEYGFKVDPATIKFNADMTKLEFEYIENNYDLEPGLNYETEWHIWPIEVMDPCA